MASAGTGLSPVPYRVRRSDRARHVRLHVRPHDGLVVVVPRRFDLGKVPALLEANAGWITRALARVASSLEQADEPPSEIELLALGESWQVDYYPTTPSGRTASREPAPGHLIVSAPAGEAREVLIRWLVRRARRALADELARRAEGFGLSYAALSIRAQRTRWGSCSATGRISLNRSLLFLPPPLVELVMVHELCHLEQMNHGPQFWSLLAGRVDDLPKKRRDLREAWRYVPAWAR